MDCDFKGKDLRSQQTQGSQCSATCQRTSGCTHFTWSNYNGGTCFMKQGGASKSEAVYMSGAVCGVVGGSPSQPTNCQGPTNGALGGGCETGDGLFLFSYLLKISKKG